MSRISLSNVAVRCSIDALRAARWLERRAGLVATLLFAAFFMAPQFVDGYGGDDLLSANCPGYLMIRGITLPQLLSQEIHGSICGGRFYPLALLLTFGVHFYIPSPFAFHAFVLALVMVDLVLFYYLLRLWRLEPSLASLGTLFLTLLFQLRFYHDPILQFAGLVPLLVAEILIAMIAFERYLASHQLAWKLMSLVAFAAALTTYEIAFMVAPVFAVMAHAERRGWRESLDACQSHVAVVLVTTAFTLGLRYQFGWHTNDAYCPRFDVAAICKAALFQASAAIPVSYALLSPHRVDNLLERRLFGAWQNWAIFAAAAALSWAYLRQFTRRAALGSPAAADAARQPTLSLFAIAGVVIWILPGVLLALSPKYQEILDVGLGYIPVFLQYFGVAMIAIGLVKWAHDYAPRLWPNLVWGIVACNALVAMVTFDTNRAVADRINTDPVTKSRSLVESACYAGLFDQTPTDATVWSTQSHCWMIGGPDRAGGHLSKTLGRRVYALIGDPAPNWLQRRFTPDSIPSPTFVMNDRLNDDWAYAILGFVTPADRDVADVHLSAEEAGAEAYPIRQFRLFLSGSSVGRFAQPKQLAVAVDCRESTDDPAAKLTQWIDLAELEVVERNDQGVILRGTFAQPVDMRVVRVLEFKDITRQLADRFEPDRSAPVVAANDISPRQ